MDEDRTKFGDYFNVKHGYAFKSEFFADSGNYVVVTPGNFFDEGGFKKKGDKEKFYTGAVPEGFVLKKGDLVVAMTEQAEGLLGSSALIPEDNYYLHNQRLGLITDLDEDRLDKKFLYYLFNFHDVRNQIRATATGAKIRHTAPERILNVRFKYLPIKIQRCIAKILSAYDDLIENNTRRIHILEEMARRIYEEWFVRFGFPGHENVRMVESEIGLIPDGWSIASLKDTCSFISRGISPKYNDVSEQFVINQKCIRDEKLNLGLVRRHSCNVPSDKVVRFGDVLINSTGVGTLGRVAQVYTDVRNYTVDTHVTIVRPKSEIDKDYFGLSLLKLQTHFDRLGFGATGQTELSRTSVADTEILVPLANVQDCFSKTVSPMRKNAILLTQKNENLRRTRDLLLPKLISGELDASNFPEPVID